MPFLTLTACLLVVATLSGCGSPSPSPSPAGEAGADVDAGRPQAEQMLTEREAAIEQREADLAARERADGVEPPSTHPQTTAPRRDTVERPRAATSTNVASHALAGDGPTPAAGTAHAAADAQPRVVQIPAGTQLQVELLDGLSSGTSTAGQEFGGRLTADVVVDGTVVLPAESRVSGTVTQAVPRKKVGGTAQISLTFDRVTLPSGKTVAISAPFTEVGKSETGKDAATIGGAAVAGAILGHQVSDKHGKLVGAILGGAAGTAVAAKTGHEVELPAGTVLAVPLDQGASVSVPR